MRHLAADDGRERAHADGLDRGVEYGFQVVAVNAPGESVPSNVVTVVL